MKHTLHAITALLCCGSTFAQDKKPEPPKKDAPEATAPDPNAMLQRAMTTMGALQSFHLEGTFTLGGRAAQMSGDLGAGSIDIVVKGFDGKTTHRRAVKGAFWTSTDGGKTWKEDAEKQQTIMFSNIVTAPVSAESKAWTQGEFAIVGEEKLGAETTLHVRKPQEGKSAAMDFWFAKDDKLGLVIRKASIVIAADDGEFPVTMTYTKLNEPVKIEAPAK